MAKKTTKPKISFFQVLGITGKILGSIISIIFMLFFLMLIIGFFGLFMGGEIETGNVALIQINGLITATGTDSMMQNGVKSDDIVSLIEKAEENKKIKAILFEINSGGGSPVASDEISEAIKKAEKPTVALIREAGASGAFWIATSADKVYANRMSVTGSIGVTSAGLTFEDFIEQYNITYRRLTIGEYKDTGSVWRGMTQQEKTITLERMQKIQEEFIKAIAENRNLETSFVEKYADGSIFLGNEAKEAGFIDELGNKQDVKKYLKEKLGEDITFRKYKTSKGLAEILSGVITEQSMNVGRGLGDKLLQEDNTKVLV